MNQYIHFFGENKFCQGFKEHVCSLQIIKNENRVLTIGGYYYLVLVSGNRPGYQQGTERRAPPY